MSATRRQMALEIVRIVVVVALALLLGFFITALVSDDPVGAYTEFLTGPLPKVSINDDGSWQLRGVNRFGNWIEDSITLILLGLSVAIVFSARQFSLGAEGQLFWGFSRGGGQPLHPGPGGYSHQLGLDRRRISRFYMGFNSRRTESLPQC